MLTQKGNNMREIEKEIRQQILEAEELEQYAKKTKNENYMSYQQGRQSGLRESLSIIKRKMQNESNNTN